MKDVKKDSQLNIRISNQQKEEVSKMAENAGYKSISKFLIDLALNNLEVKVKNNRKIYVTSLSPTIDYFIKTKEIGENKDGNNKFFKEDRLFVPGGRGINLSKILNAYNINNLNINFATGFSGKELHRQLQSQGVKQYRIETDTETKINIYAEDSKGKDVSLEEKTSNLSSFAKEELFTFIDNNLKKGDEFVLSGSFSIDDVKYIKKLVNKLNEMEVKIYINSSSINVSKVIGNSSPELIVLCLRNFHGAIKSKKDIFDEMEKFLKLGCKNVAFISDINYSLFMNKENKFLISTDLVEKLTYSGLEDAFVAGYLANIGKPIEDNLTWAAASVRAKADDKEIIHFDHIVNYLKEVIIKNS